LSAIAGALGELIDRASQFRQRRQGKKARLRGTLPKNMSSLNSYSLALSLSLEKTHSTVAKSEIRLGIFEIGVTVSGMKFWSS